MYSRFAMLLAAALASTANGQTGPNEIYKDHINDMTMSFNGTAIVVPLNAEFVANLVKRQYPGKSFNLVPLPNNSSRFPDPWPSGTHPVMFTGGYDVEIKQLFLDIPSYLMGARIEVPCVDKLGDGKTCFRAPISTYVGGENGQLQSGLIPSLVATLEGTTVFPGKFDPNTAALKDITNGQYSFEVDALYFDNPFSGPGAAPPAFQFTIAKTDSSPLLTALGFHFFISQPYIASDGVRCARSETYFNVSFANPFFSHGNVTVLPSTVLDNEVPHELVGSYTNGTGYSANGQQVTYKAQDCAEAVRQSGPAADM